MTDFTTTKIMGIGIRLTEWRDRAGNPCYLRNDASDNSIWIGLDQSEERAMAVLPHQMNLTREGLASLIVELQSLKEFMEAKLD